MMIFGVAPIIAPSVGGFLISFLGWRWLFGVLVVIGGLILLPVGLLLKESHGPDPSVSLRLDRVVIG